MNAQDADRAADAVGNGLADRFESERPRLQAIAYRILGSLGEAEDAVQESWLRLSRALTRPAADTAGSPPDSPADSPADSPISNLPGWLTTTVSRICLDMLRTRASRREDLVAEPDPASAPTAAPASSPFAEPEDEALLADATGRALLVVLDRLSPPERVAFVLHDAFAVPFDEIAHIVDRSPQTTKKLASRARLKVRGGTTLTPDSASAAELARQRRVAEKFLSAARSGDLRAIIELLAPDVVRRADPAALTPGRPLEVRGADAVAKEITLFGQASRYAEPALINGTTIGILVAPRGRLHLVLALTIDAMSDLITAYELVADPGRLSRLDLAVLGVRAQ
jgi:RNA polymerase sigma factor (sigma-70 family)